MQLMTGKSTRSGWFVDVNPCLDNLLLKWVKLPEKIFFFKLCNDSFCLMLLLKYILV